MAVTKAQQKAVHKYVKANYDRMELTLPKGGKDLVKARAASQGKTVNGYISDLIEKDMGPFPRRDAQEVPADGSQS